MFFFSLDASGNCVRWINREGIFCQTCSAVAPGNFLDGLTRLAAVLAQFCCSDELGARPLALCHGLSQHLPEPRPRGET